MAGVKSIGVVGAGTMGSGIAQLAAQTGHRVRLYDVSDEILDKALERIRGFWKRGVEKGRLTPEAMQEALERLSGTRSFEDFSDVDLVIEAALEDLDVKHQIFEQLDRHCPEQALLATNTSSLSVSAIAKETKNPARVAGMHFFNPAPLMALVELIQGENTSDDTMDALREVSRALDKTPVTALDTPGFIVNRVARPFYVEPLRILGEGLANPATIDATLEKAGFRMGPFALMDLVGIDVNFAVSNSVYSATGQERFKPHRIQQEMVEKGLLGRKTKEGFYAYPHGKPKYTERSGEPAVSGFLTCDPEATPELTASIYIRKHAKKVDQPLRVLPRILCSVINEAVHLLGEGIASKEDIDTAMCLGLNWPTGPLRWGEQIGLRVLVSVLDILRISTGEERFRAALMLLETVRRGKKELGEP